MKTKRKLDYKWELIVMLWFAYFLNQGDRQVYNAVIPFIENDLGLSSVQTGLVATVFTIVYGCLVPFGGYLGDFLRRKWIVVTSLLIFSIGTLFTGFAGGLVALIIMRGITTGGGEAFYYPAATSLITQHHEDTRATAMSIHQTSLYIGIIVSAFVAPVIAHAFGWRWAFLAFGVFGILVAVWIIFRMRDTKQIAQAEGRVPFKELVKGIFSKKTIWFLAIAFGCQVFVNIGITTWSAKFFNLKFLGGDPSTLSTASLLAMLTSCGFAILGVMIGGRLSDRGVKKNRKARMRTEYLGLLCGAPFLALVGFAPNIWTACIAMSLYGVFRGVYDSNLYAAMFDVIDPRLRSSSVGVMTAFAFLMGCIAPVYLGAVQGDGSSITHFGWGIASLGLFFLFGGFMIFLASKLTFDKDYYETSSDK